MLFEDRMAFDDGEHRVELIHVGPGHTIGDAVAYLPKEKILVTGDLCVNWTSGNNTGDRDADPDNWVKVLDLLAKSFVPQLRGRIDLACKIPNAKVPNAKKNPKARNI